jgi:hypothetical protein
MGTASTKKVIKQVSGVLTEEAALVDSAGAGDADRIPALNASGILDDSIINASATSSANKIVKQNGSGIIAPAILNATVTSAGAGDAAKIAQLDGSGRLDNSVMPVGIGADTAIITTSEALAAGDFVNIHSSSGAKVRKADATTAGKEAHGFVLAGAASAASATVYFEGPNTAVSGQTPGVVFLQTTAGTAGTTAPSAAGNIVQKLGVATSATSINFERGEQIVLA